MRLGTPEPRRLIPYRQALPPNEFAALDAWLSQFYPFQLRWLLEPAKRAACVKSRQIGFSHTSGAAGIIWSALHGELTTIVSKGDRESLEVLDKAKRHAAVLAKLGSRMAVPVGDRANEIRFPSGGRIIALPSSGGRGFTGNLILDEFAYHQNPEAVWDAAAPAMRLGDFRLRVLSTPNGTGDVFSGLIDSIRSGTMKRTALHQVTIDDALADGFPVDLGDCWEDARHDPRLFDQLYRCKFLDSNLQYIPSDLFARACNDEDTAEQGLNYGGLDIGETRDRTVLTIVRRQGSARRLVHIESHRLTDDDLLDKLAAKAFQTYNVRRLSVDATGLGSFPAKRMRRAYGSRLEPVNFTPTSKEDLATALYDSLASGEFTIPKTYVVNGQDEIPLLRDDVFAIRRLVTSAGNVRYDAAHSGAGHADRAWSLMLALHAAGQMSAMFAALQKRRGAA